LSAAALQKLIAMGYWRRTADAREKLDRPVFDSELQDAVRNTHVELPKGNSERKVVSRSAFAIWLMKVYVARQKISSW
jgi:hypothetical protein